MLQRQATTDMEGLQGHHRRIKTDQSVRHRSRGPTGTRLHCRELVPRTGTSTTHQPSPY